MEISFLGAANTVTGSKYLLRNNEDQILVDCGLFQGLKQLRLLNWDPIAFDPELLNAIILTHAHLDHCGYLPIAVKEGFKGPIYGTAPTLELAKIILLDAAQIQEEDAEYANRKGFSKHHPALPLFSLIDVEKTLSLFRPVDLNAQLNIGSFNIQLSSGGHILGASSVLVKTPETSIFFSGDLGRYDDPLMPAPMPPMNSDYVVMESTYGDRRHSSDNSKETLTKLINQVFINNGVLLIPAFAVGRSQNLIFEIVQLKEQGLIPETIPIYYNSPMGKEVWRLYGEFTSFQKINSRDFDRYTKQVHFIKNAEQSKQLNEKKGPMIIIAASGMLTGGRVLHHLKAFAGNSQNIILLAGFQAMGTRGWSLAAGLKRIKLHGLYLDVEAQIISSDCFSSHADQSELLKWLTESPKKQKCIFLTHGEPSATDELRKKIEETLKLKVVVPMIGETFNVNSVANKVLTKFSQYFSL